MADLRKLKPRKNLSCGTPNSNIRTAFQIIPLHFSLNFFKFSVFHKCLSVLKQRRFGAIYLTTLINAPHSHNVTYLFLIMMVLKDDFHFPPLSKYIKILFFTPWAWISAARLSFEDKLQQLQRRWRVTFPLWHCFFIFLR